MSGAQAVGLLSTNLQTTSLTFCNADNKSGSKASGWPVLPGKENNKLLLLQIKNKLAGLHEGDFIIGLIEGTNYKISCSKRGGVISKGDLIELLQ